MEIFAPKFLKNQKILPIRIPSVGPHANDKVVTVVGVVNAGRVEEALVVHRFEHREVSVRIAENEVDPNRVLRFRNPISKDVGLVPAVVIHFSPLTFVTRTEIISLSA